MQFSVCIGVHHGSWPMNDKTLVLGIGNHLLMDEGIGIHAIEQLRARYPASEHVTLLDGGTLSFTLAGPIAEAHKLIVIDAAQFDAVPGSICLFEDDEMDRFLTAGGKRSVHEVGLVDLLAIARLTEALPHRRALIGIQPHRMDWGEQPSEALAAVLPQVCDMTLSLIQEWNQ